MYCCSHYAKTPRSRCQLASEFSESLPSLLPARAPLRFARARPPSTALDRLLRAHLLLSQLEYRVACRPEPPCETCATLHAPFAVLGSLNSRFVAPSTAPPRALKAAAESIASGDSIKSTEALSPLADEQIGCVGSAVRTPPFLARATRRLREMRGLSGCLDRAESRRADRTATACSRHWIPGCVSSSTTRTTQHTLQHYNVATDGPGTHATLPGSNRTRWTA